jgi:hypothetical protein
MLTHSVVERLADSGFGSSKEIKKRMAAIESLAAKGRTATTQHSATRVATGFKLWVPRSR